MVQQTQNDVNLDNITTNDFLKKGYIWGWLGAFLGYLFDYYEVALLSIIIVPISRLYSWPAEYSVLALGTLLLFLAIGGVSAGYLADRKLGRRAVIIISILVYSIATLARAGTFNFIYFLILVAIAGWGMGGEFGVGQSLITEIAPRNRRGFWSGAFYGSGGFGIILAATMGIFVLPVVGFRWVFVISGLFGLVIFGILRIMPESDIWQKKKTEIKSAQETAATKSTMSKSPYLNFLFFGLFFALLALGTMQFFMYYLVNTDLPLYLTSKGLTVTHASYFIFVIGSGVTAGSFFGAYLSDVIGRRATGTVGAVIVAVFALILYSMGHNFLVSPYVLIPFFFLGLGFATPAQVLGVFFSEKFPTMIRATATSATLQIARGLSFFPPFVALYLYSLTKSYSDIFLVGMIIALVEAAYFWAFKETKAANVNY